MSFTCDAVEAQCQTEISLIAWHKGIATTQTAAEAAATLLLIRRGNELVAVFPTSPLGTCVAMTATAAASALLA